MKYRIIAILCVLCLLVGCKVELPKQQDKSSSIISSKNSSSVSQQNQSEAVSSAASSRSVVTSSPVSSTSLSKPTSQAISKSTSSNAVAPKVPTASKAPSAVAAYNCSLFITCSDILKNKDQFSAEQLSVVPKDGLIYQASGITFKDGDTVYDLLIREMKAKNINVDHATSPLYGATYINGIDNIYEKKYGSSSGWLYAVNGKQPPVGCSSYKLKSGDKIQWIYVCN